MEKMKRLFSIVFLVAMIIIVAMTGCEKNDSEGDGILKINGHEYSITNANMYVGTISIISSFIGRHIFFTDKEGKVTVQVTMEPSEFTSKTYTNENTYMFCGLLMNDESAINAVNFVMVVNKSGKTYDIKIIGQTEEEYEYTMTYKGAIHEGR